MSLQYSEEEINDFIQKLQQDVRSNMLKMNTVISMGFALGRVDPQGVRKRSAHVLFSQPVRSYAKLIKFSAYVRTMALRAEAECAGCVVSMPAVVMHTETQESIKFEDGDCPPDAQETVMIHAEQLSGGHRFWYAHVQVVEGESSVSDFEELNVHPHPNHPYFLPIEMYGPTTVQA